MSEKTNLTVVIDKEIKHMAKVKAIMMKLTLREYVQKVIWEDLGVDKDGEKMDWWRNTIFEVCLS